MASKNTVQTCYDIYEKERKKKRGEMLERDGGDLRPTPGGLDEFTLTGKSVEDHHDIEGGITSMDK